MSGNFEAKNYMYRKNKDGIIVGLVVHPNDVDAAFAALPIGARVMIGWAQIGDDEKPVENDEISHDGASPAVAFDVPRPRANEAGISKPKKRFEDYPLSAQCAMRCEEPAFMTFLQLNTVENVIAWVRNFCDVKSRSELDRNARAAEKWRALEDRYQKRLTDQKYAGARR